MSSSNNAYKINELTNEEGLEHEESKLKHTIEDTVDIKQLDDSMIALSYVIQSLEERNISSIATILKISCTYILMLNRLQAEVI